MPCLVFSDILPAMRAARNITVSQKADLQRAQYEFLTTRSDLSRGLAARVSPPFSTSETERLPRRATACRLQFGGPVSGGQITGSRQAGSTILQRRRQHARHQSTRQAPSQLAGNLGESASRPLGIARKSTDKTVNQWYYFSLIYYVRLFFA